MKKFIVCAFAALAMLCMTSCGGPASKAVGYVEDGYAAMEEGNIEKYCEIIVKAAEFEASLNADEKKEADEAVDDWKIEHKADIEKAEAKWDKALEKASAKDKQAVRDARDKARKAAQGKDTEDDED